MSCINLGLVTLEHMQHVDFPRLSACFLAKALLVQEAAAGLDDIVSDARMLPFELLNA